MADNSRNKIYHKRFILSHDAILKAQAVKVSRERKSRLYEPYRDIMNSRNKGASGERELANKLKEYGYDTRRGQQYCGANGDADVVGLPMTHIECKRVERLNIHEAMKQAVHDAKENEKPAVFHRKNRCDWLVTMRLDDWIELYREWANGYCGTDANRQK